MHDSLCRVCACMFVSASLLGLSHNSCRASKVISIMIIIILHTHSFPRQMEDPDTETPDIGERYSEGIQHTHHSLSAFSICFDMFVLDRLCVGV